MNRIASFTAGVVLVAVMIPRPARAQQADNNADPNLPGLVSPGALRIQWNNYDKGNPQVIMPGQDHGATYLGWNDQGSWLVGADDGKIDVWNLRQNSLTMVYKNYKQIPQETIASLKNNPLAATKGTPQDTGPKQTGPKPGTPAPANDLDDPNLPGLTSPRGLKIQWSNYVKGSPQVIFTTPEVPSGHQAHYMGWNEQGSWFMNNEDGHIYVWNLKENSLKKVYEKDKDIPQSVLASMHNLKDDFLLANFTPQNTEPKQTGPKVVTPDTSRQAAFFGGAGNVPQAAVPGAITGSGAAIQNGMLTFTRADNSKASYKVVRPKVAQGAPGNTGAWIAMGDGGKGILFTVNADNSVTGREMPAQIIQALMQAAR